jgi:hypothetical protein
VLTTIQAGYITMKLNYVVGLGGWAFERSEVQIVEDHKTVEVTLFIADNEGVVASHTAFGGSRNPGPDGLKSAVTDGLTKAASYFGLGQEVFCGEITAESLANYEIEKVKKAAAQYTPPPNETYSVGDPVAPKKKVTKEEPKVETASMSGYQRGKLHSGASNHFENGQVEEFLNWFALAQVKVVNWKESTKTQAAAMLEVFKDTDRLVKAVEAFKKGRTK